MTKAEFFLDNRCAVKQKARIAIFTYGPSKMINCNKKEFDIFY